MSQKEISEETIAKFKERMEAAKILIAGDKFEDAVSRLYYALFDAIRGMLEIKKITAKSHRGAISKFHENFFKTGIIDNKFSNTISKLIKLREGADYTFQMDLSKGEAKKAFHEVENFLAVIEKYLKDNYSSK